MTTGPPVERADMNKTFIAMTGLLISVLAFALTVTAHFERKLKELEAEIDTEIKLRVAEGQERSKGFVPKEVYERHNHGGTVPSEK